MENSWFLFQSHDWKRKMIDSISVIVPVANEPQNIQRTLESICLHISLPKEILVIYDSDTDATLPILDKIKIDFHDLKIIKNNIHPGPSGALITGFNEASKKYILVMMADLCDDISEIDKTITRFSPSFDIVSFSRFLTGGSVKLKKPKKRLNRIFFKHYLKLFLPKLASFFMGSFGGLEITDPTNSYKLYSTEMVKRLKLKSRTSFSVTLEIVMKAKALGFQFQEIPTTWTDREFGKTNFPLAKSLVAYLPWFCIILISNRLYSLPKSTFEKRFLK